MNSDSDAVHLFGFRRIELFCNQTPRLMPTKNSLPAEAPICIHAKNCKKCGCEVVPSSTFPNSFSLQDTFPTMVNNEHVHRSQPILTGFRAGGLGTVSSDPLVLNDQLHPHASWNPGPILSCALDQVCQHRSFGIIVTD